MLSINRLSVYLICFLLVAEQFLNSELYSILIYASLFIIVIINKVAYSDKFQRTIIFILLSIIVVSVFNYLFDFRVVNYNISARDVIRDFWFFSRPVFIVIIGYNLGKKTLPEDLIKAIIIVGLLSAFIHYLEIIQYGSLDFLDGRKNDVLSGASLIEAIVFSIVILRLFRSESGKFDSIVLNDKRLLLIVLFFITPSFIFYLSRTMFIVVLAVLFFGFELYKINARSLAVGSVILLMIASVFLVQSSDNFFIFKIQRSVSEIGVGANDYETMLDENSINNVWRGYEAYRATNQLFENNKFVWLWGEGVGSKVDLKIYQKLGEQEFRFIPKLHNAYVMVLFKSGIIGLLLYLFLIYKLMFGFDKREFLPVNGRDIIIKLAKGIGLCFLLISIVIGGIYNKGEGAGLLLIHGAFLGSLNYKGPYILGLLKVSK